MELTLIGHDCRYQVEQLQTALFGVDAPGSAVSTVTREGNLIRFNTQITIGDLVTTGHRQLDTAEETLTVFYRCLRQHVEIYMHHVREVLWFLLLHST